MYLGGDFVGSTVHITPATTNVGRSSKSDKASSGSS